jgi:glycerophosphoryl diester phosphodiesterase
MAAYELAIHQGADFIEPDLVPTRDGVLIARHENEIGGTTDVAGHPEFASRRTTKIVSGKAVSGWFTEEFRWVELQTLRARERLPELRPASAAHDDQFGLVRLEEIIALTRRCTAELGRTVGVVAELKHAAYFAGLGLPLHELLGAVLAVEKVEDDGALYVESFEPGVLEQLRGKAPGRLVQLLEAHGAPADRPGVPYAQMATPDGLRHIADYADAIGPAKALIVPRAPDGRSLAPTTLVADAHAAGLDVLAWTFRSENLFLPAELRGGADLSVHGNAAAEYRRFYDLGVDAVFSDYPAEAVAAREAR